MRIRLAPILLATLVLGLAACGGSDDDSAAPATATTAAEANGGEATTSTSDAPTSFASAENCAQLANLSAAFSQAAASGGTDLEDQAKFFEDFANQTPEEIRPDFQILARAFSAYLTAYAKLDLKPGATPTAEQIAQLSQIASAFSQPEVQQASQHVSTWASQNCKTS